MNLEMPAAFGDDPQGAAARRSGQMGGPGHLRAQAMIGALAPRDGRDFMRFLRASLRLPPDALGFRHARGM